MEKKWNKILDKEEDRILYFLTVLILFLAVFFLGTNSLSVSDRVYGDKFPGEPQRKVVATDKFPSEPVDGVAKELTWS